MGLWCHPAGRPPWGPVKVTLFLPNCHVKSSLYTWICTGSRQNQRASARRKTKMSCEETLNKENIDPETRKLSPRRAKHTWYAQRTKINLKENQVGKSTSRIETKISVKKVGERRALRDITSVFISGERRGIESGKNWDTYRSEVIMNMR